MDSGKNRVIVKNLIQIIFEELDPVWLKYMWDVDGATRKDMIKIIYMLYLIKSKIWLRTVIVKLEL